MRKRDDIAVINQRHWEKMVKEGCGFTRPWLELNASLVDRYVKGKLNPIPKPLLSMYPTGVLADAKGKDVLCLAAGGGQQSVVFSLLGARVTVVDLSQGQLNADQEAATYYGYKMDIIQGDMRDLSCVGDRTFDIIWGTGMSYVPKAEKVFSEVAKVLRTKGKYRVDFMNPATEFVDCDDWDGEGYRITRPYRERIRRSKDGPIEFRHALSSIFNGLLQVGLSLEHVQEAPYYHQKVKAPPGSWEHWRQYVTGFAIVVRKDRSINLAKSQSEDYFSQ